MSEPAAHPFTRSGTHVGARRGLGSRVWRREEPARLAQALLADSQAWYAGHVLADRMCIVPGLDVRGRVMCASHVWRRAADEFGTRGLIAQALVTLDKDAGLRAAVVRHADSRGHWTAIEYLPGELPEAIDAARARVRELGALVGSERWDRSEGLAVELDWPLVRAQLRELLGR